MSSKEILTKTKRARLTSEFSRVFASHCLSVWPGYSLQFFADFSRYAALCYSNVAFLLGLCGFPANFVYSSLVQSVAPSLAPAGYQIHDTARMCMDELMMIQKSYTDLSASTLYEFDLIKGASRVELGLAEQSKRSASVINDLHALHPACSAFESVCMPDEIFESAHLVFMEFGTECDDPAALASTVSETPRISESLKSQHLSKLRGMGYRRDLLNFLVSICGDNCDGKVFESISHILSVPLAFRDELSILNLDEARLMRSETFLRINDRILGETHASDIDLHANLLAVCKRKFEQRADADLLDFAKALKSIVSLVNDTSSSTFLMLCFRPGTSEQPPQPSIFSCVVALAQLCTNRAASDLNFGTKHAAAAFVFMTIAVDIVTKQKTGPLDEPQKSKYLEETFTALNHMSDLDQFHTALSEVRNSNCCRFVASWLLAGEGQFFKLFHQHQEILSSLVPLNERLLLRECVTFIRLESFQNYIPSVCYQWLSNQQTFHKEFVAIFSSQARLDTASIPSSISPFPPIFVGEQSTILGGQLIAALFNPDQARHIKQEAAASIIANVIGCDSDVSANQVQLIASILYRIKSGENFQGSRIAIETLLPVMENEGLHGIKEHSGAIQGGWYLETGFFMAILNGWNLDSAEKLKCLKQLSVRELLEQLNGKPHLFLGCRVRIEGLQNPSSIHVNGRTGVICADVNSEGRWKVDIESDGSYSAVEGRFRPENLKVIHVTPPAFLVNSIFANFILLTRGIVSSQNMWRLQVGNHEWIEGLYYRMKGDLSDGIPSYIGRAFAILGCCHDSPQLLFSMPEMIAIAAALLSARNFAWRRPLNAAEIEMCMSGMLPLFVHIQSNDVDSIAKSMFTMFSPEIYVACFDNAKKYDQYFAKIPGKQVLFEPMKALVNQNFLAIVSVLMKLSSANAAVATRFIRLYFDCISSMFTFCTTHVPMFWMNDLNGIKSNPFRKSMFDMEAWPKSKEHDDKFHAENVLNILDIISSKNAFEFIWSSSKDLQDVIYCTNSFPQQLICLNPMHQVVAHAITFAASKMLTVMLSMEYYTRRPEVDTANEQSAEMKVFRASYENLHQLCSLLLPSVDQQNEHERKWFMALPVVKEILAQNSSFLSNASLMFLGEPVLADGHLFAASHSLWAIGKPELHARSISSGSYDNHPLFSADSEERQVNTAETKPLAPKITLHHSFAAISSSVIEVAFDFHGRRSSFLDWLHQAFASSLSVDPSGFKKNMKVRIHSLTGTQSQHLNGRVGIVLEKKVNVDGVRWEVEISADVTRPAGKGQFKEANLECIPYCSPSLLAELVADILSLMSASQLQKSHTTSMWHDVNALERLEYDLWCMIDRQQTASMDSSFNAEIVQHILTRMRQNLNAADAPKFRVHSQPLLDTADSESSLQHRNIRDIFDRMQEFQVKLREWPDKYTIPAHACCQMLGSFFRISATRIALKHPDAPIFDETALFALCHKFLDWSAKADLHKREVLDRSSDTNTFSSVSAACLETTRAAIHCLILLPYPQANLSRAVRCILPLLNDESNGDLIEVVVSTIARPSKYSLAQLQKDSLVLVHDLTSDKAAVMNGKIGKIMGDCNPDSQRWPVQVQVSEDDQRIAALYSKNIFSEHLSAKDSLDLLSTIMLDADGQPKAAFKVVLNRSAAFLKLCHWLMINQCDVNCSRLLIQLISLQNFPKIVDNFQPRPFMTGIVNVGNTCFIASLYQQLASIPKFVASLQSATLGPDGSSKALSKTSKLVYLKELFNKISHQSQCMSNNDVKSYFLKLGFALDGQQDDPISLLVSMIGWIVAETSDYDRHKHGDEKQMRQTAQDSSFLAITLVSRICSRVSWQDSAITSSQHRHNESFFEQIDTVTVSPTEESKSIMNIEEVLKAHFIEKPSLTHNKPCKVTMEFESLPQVLILGLNSCGNFKLGYHKDPRVPSISKELDMSKCAKLSSSAAQGNTTYVLNGIILHHGSDVSSGHYTSLVRCADASWVHLNDHESFKVDSRDLDTILQRDGSALPTVDGKMPIYLTGKPYGLFYVQKSACHPCSAVLFEPRLVKCLRTFAESPLSELTQSTSSATVAFDTISLCFKLAPLFSHDSDCSLSLATVCNKLSLSASQSQSRTLITHFQNLAVSEDPELLLALCKLRATDLRACEKLLCPDLIVKLAEDSAAMSSRDLHRRLVVSFDVASQLSSETQEHLCRSVCDLMSRLLPSSTLPFSPESVVSTKAYAVLKCISNLSLDSPYLRHFSNDHRFSEAVNIIAESLPAAAAAPPSASLSVTMPPAAAPASHTAVSMVSGPASNLCVASHTPLPLHLLHALRFLPLFDAVFVLLTNSFLITSAGEMMTVTVIL